MDRNLLKMIGDTLPRLFHPVVLDKSLTKVVSLFSLYLKYKLVEYHDINNVKIINPINIATLPAFGGTSSIFSKILPFDVFEEIDATFFLEKFLSVVSSIIETSSLGGILFICITLSSRIISVPDKGAIGHL